MSETGHGNIMKECRDIRELLSAMLDDAATIEEQQRIAIHLTTCPRCQAALTELRRTMALLRDQGEVEPPTWLTTRIMARIAEESAPECTIWQRLFQPWPIKVPLQALALVALCVTGYYLTRENLEQVDFSAPARDAATPAPATAPEPAQKAPATTVPIPLEQKEQAPSKPAVAPLVKPATPATTPPPAPRAKDTQPVTTFTPSPAAPLMLKESSRGAAPAMKSLPAAEKSNERLLQLRDAAPIAAGAKRKAIKEESFDQNWDAPTLILRLIANEPATISAEITRLAQRLGGSGTAISPRSLSVQLPAQRYQDFQAGLARLGGLQVAQRAQATSGLLHLHISWD
jgi:hypothetical protein